MCKAFCGTAGTGSGWPLAEDYAGCRLLKELWKSARVEQVYTQDQGLAYTVITSLAVAADGSIWAGGARGGVSRLPPDFPDRPLRTFSTPHGLTGEAILSVAVDREGNTWLGSDGSGAMKIARHGFTTYTEADGLANGRIESLFEDRAGALYASAVRNSVRAINRFDGERFTAIYPNLEQQHGKLGWGWAQIILQDHAGEWWVSTGEGLGQVSADACRKTVERTAVGGLFSAGCEPGLPRLRGFAGCHLEFHVR